MVCLGPACLLSELVQSPLLARQLKIVSIPFRGKRAAVQAIAVGGSRLRAPVPEWRASRFLSSTALFASKSSKLPGLSLELDDKQTADAIRAVEQAKTSADTWSVCYTDFLTPPVCKAVMEVVAPLADIAATPSGGYEQAERCRLIVGRQELVSVPSYPGTPMDDGVAAMEVSGNFLFDPADHRDFLGSILGTGIAREKVGDIIPLGDRGAQFFTTPDLVGHFEMNLTQVRTVSVKTREIDFSEIKVLPQKVSEIVTVEASMRLDAIGSAGFRMSRGKVVDLIKSNSIRVNWNSTSKASLAVKEGDVISCSGRGRIEIRTVSLTKKGKYKVVVARYV